MSITGAVEGLGNIANLVNKIIDQLDTPEKRAKARRDFISELRSYMERVNNEEDLGAIQRIVADFLIAVDSR